MKRFILPIFMLITFCILLPCQCLLAGTTLFESNWNHSTGDLCPALTDGGAWSYDATRDYSGINDPDISAPCTFHYAPPGGGHLEVFSGGPNSNNALAIWVNGNTGVSFVEKQNIFNVTGDYSYIRAYFYIHDTGYIGNEGHSYHFFEDFHNAVNWYINLNNINETSHTWQMTSWSQAQYNAYGYGEGRQFAISNLPTNEWVRIEIQIHYLEERDASTRTITNYRIYNESGALIGDNDEMIETSSPHSTLSQFYSGGGYFYWDHSSDQTRGLKIGNNGPASNTRIGRLIDVAAIKITSSISDDDWIGAFSVSDTTPPAEPSGLQVN